MDYNYLNSDDFRNPNYKDKGKGDEPCFLCGRAVDGDNRKHIHLLTDGCFVDSADDFGDKDQGFFPVGPECGKKIPKNFLF